ncbi:MAG: hypothetical protein A3F72_21255 [Bacteroidetes bacterium RIFCSPLOWO2_12_FULL_35_15]|nr:MAG: hypothetical protein A3F72_21255 [Bacteroidetes bacterium RIFCSPLOWO2_12_FULL_35_15]
MLSVEKAKQAVIENVSLLSVENIPIEKSYGYVLAEDIYSPLALPPFNQSAMDGYAFIFDDLKNKLPLKIIAEVAAGNQYKETLRSGDAIRIFTGAPVPLGADCIVMQEKVRVEINLLHILDTTLNPYSNIRLKGSQIEKEELALSKGTKVTAATIGFIAGMGITSIQVVRKPKVNVIVTGSELQKPGNPLKEGQIFESNSYSISAALNSMDLSADRIESVADNEVEVNAIIARSIETCDVLVLSGGISVGDYDFVERGLKNSTVEPIFYKVKQKPGKPLFFGKYKNTIVFALPGNPAAVLSCFYNYVYPALRKMQGFSSHFLKSVKLPISTDYPKKSGLSNFLNAKMDKDKILPLEGQASYILRSYAIADSIIYLPEESENLKAGELVEVFLLPK